jgi:type I restriction enzyme, S subunit
MKIKTSTVDELCNVEYGTRVTRKNDGGKIYPVYGGGGETFFIDKENRNNRVVISRFAMSKKCTRLVKGNFFLNDSGLTLSPKRNDISQQYLDKIILALNDSIYDLGRGTAQRNLNMKQFRLLKISYPTSFDEQEQLVTKLNATFDKIDMAIEKTISSMNNLKNITQLYFNNIDEKKISNLSEKNIGDICNLMTGGTPNTKNKTYFKNGKIPWLVSGDINKGIIYDCDGRITELGYKNSNAKYLPINSVIIALNGQGKTRGTVALLKIKATCNQSLVSIYPKEEEKINIEYIYYYLKSKYTQIRKITGDSGNDRRGLNMPLIRKIKIKFPKNYHEQIILVNKIKNITKNVLKLKNNYQSKINNLSKLKKEILRNNLFKKESDAA